MEHEYEIVWTEPSVADLEEITAFIARDNPSAAQRIGAAILHHVETLRSFPFIGPTYPRGARGRNREIAYRKYRIFYRVVPDQGRVEVLTVWHGARAEPDLDV